jgi:hypothetical protein
MTEKLAEAVSLTCYQELRGLSLEQETYHLELSFFVFPNSPAKFWDSTSNQAVTVSFFILSNPSNHSMLFTPCS